MRYREIRFMIKDFSPAAKRMTDRRRRYFFAHGRWPDDAPQVRDTLYRMALLGEPYVEKSFVSGP
jgi:hypothetical protein